MTYNDRNFRRGSTPVFALPAKAAAVLAGLAVFTAVAFAVGGCAPRTAVAPSAAAGGVPGQAAAGPMVVAPAAQPGMDLNAAANPPAGQPNHMSAAMQAQMQRYQSMGQKK